MAAVAATTDWVGNNRREQKCGEKRKTQVDRRSVAATTMCRLGWVNPLLSTALSEFIEVPNHTFCYDVQTTNVS